MSHPIIKPEYVPPIDPVLYCAAYREAMGRHGVVDPAILFLHVGEQSFRPVYFRVEALIEELKKMEFTPEMIPASATCKLRVATLKFRRAELVKEVGKYKQEGSDATVSTS